MSFSVRIAADLVSVEAGATVPLGIEIANRSDEQDRFEMEVEGLDPDWTAVPVPTFAADPRDIQTEKIFFKPPRVSESLSGTFPFVIKVRSLLTGEQRTAQGILEIKPYHHLTMELSPKKGQFGAAKKTNQFQVTIMNLGNTEHTLQLYATDPEDALAYDFEQNQIAIGPGQTKTVQLIAKPTETRTFAGSKLHGFSVSARGVETPSVACSAQAQLEVKPLMSPGWIAVGVLFLLVFAGWFALIPKPPSLDTLSVDPLNPIRGSQVTVKWSSSNATSVRLQVYGQEIEVRPNDQYVFTAGESTLVRAIAYRDQKESAAKTVMVTAIDPAPVEDPVIERFNITPREARLDTPLLVQYKLGKSVTKAVLEPSGVQLDLTLEQLTIKADLTGKVVYRLVAQNSAGKTTSKSITVNVFEGSDATIIAFKLDPEKLPFDGGTVTLTWQVSGAERLDLKAGTEEMQLELPSGTRSFNISTPMEFTLTATDSKGRKVVQKKRVELEPPPTVDPPSTTGITVPPGGGG
jgi:hypothetical protein